MKRPRTLSLIMLVAVTASSLPLKASDNVESGAPISIKLNEAPGDSVLESFAQILRAELQLDMTAGRSVTLELDGVPLSDALDQVCEQLDCHWRLIPGDPVVLRVESLLRLNLKQAEVRQVLTLFAQILNLGIDIDPTLEGAVTIKLDAVPWSDALDGICEAVDCRWNLDTDSRRLKIEMRGSSTMPMESRSPVELTGPQHERPPLASIRPRASKIRLRIEGPGKWATVDRSIELDWHRPISRLPFDDGSREIVASWIPLGDRIDALFPLLIDCAEARVESFEAVVLPVETRWSGSVDGATLTLSPAAVDNETGVARSPESCVTWDPAELTVRIDDVFNGRHSVTEPGQFLQLLMVPTPDRPTSDVDAAIIVLQRSPDGGFELAALAPDSVGRVRTYRGVASIGAPWVVTLVLADGTSARLELSVR